MSNHLLAACGGGDSGSGYEITKSLRFRSSSLISLSKAYGITPTDTSPYIKTFSAWVKRGLLNTSQFIASVSNGASNYWYIGFNASNQLVLNKYVGGVVLNKVTTQVFRDPSAWYHIVIVVDMTSVITEERVKLYVNGNRITQWTSNTVPAQNGSALLALSAGSGTNTANIGNYPLNSSNVFDGYMAEIHVIDGQALTPSYFGEWNQDTGVWVPIRYTGSYGTNGFYLDFKDASAITNLGYDKSGAGNNWTPNNFSLTSGYTYDSMDDTPSNNFPTWNPLTAVTPEFRLCNLEASTSGASALWFRHQAASMTIPANNKWYWEIVNAGSSTADNVFAGFMLANSPVKTSGVEYYIGKFQGSHGVYIINSANGQGDWWSDGVQGTGFGSTDGDTPALVESSVYGFAIDSDIGIFELFRNGVSLGTRQLPLSQMGQLVPAITMYTGNIRVNFGQRPFAYTPPEGFKSLCSKNLPTPSIKRGEVGFDIATYTGNGGNIQVGEYQYPRFDYLIDKSLRFKGVNSYLSRTPGAAGNRLKWSLSVWFKRSGNGFIVCSGIGPAAGEAIAFGSAEINLYRGDGTGYLFRSNAMQNLDYVNWHHLLVIFDSANATANNRAIAYVDGVRRSATVTIGLNAQSYINSNVFTTIGIACGTTGIIGSTYTNGYLAEVNFIDGQALDPSNFGEQDINGYWIPKVYTGTYGQNGFYLDFEDTSAVANLGYDKSGRGNNWTPNNFSLTAGASYDSMVDTPTENYAVLDTLNVSLGSSSTLAISESGLYVTLGSGINQSAIYSTLQPESVSGKYYAEFTYTVASGSPNSNTVGINTAQYRPNGTINGSTVFGSSYTANDIIGIAADLDNDIAYFYKNNVLQGSQSIQKDSLFLDNNRGGFFVAVAGSPAGAFRVNFGQRPFAYTPPEGFKALNIPNIAEYTKDLESPDLVWIKSRNAAQNHMLFDSVRGVGEYHSSNLTAVEGTDVNSLIQFNKNGFYLGNNANVNTLNNTYVAWMWKANQSQLTNTDGTISAQVRANPAIGFSVVKYNGNGVTGDTVGHGLGIKPDFIIVKNLATSTINWKCYHKSLGATKVIYLSLTDAAATLNYIWNNTEPTSQLITFGNDQGMNSNLGESHIAYCFAEIEGFSKFGSYTGNGSADGPFSYLGFKPRFLMIKRVDSASDWYIWDTERDALNPLDAYLLSNTTAAETGSLNIDALSNGFKLRSAVANVNAASYIFTAFAENPFKYSNAV